MVLEVIYVVRHGFRMNWVVNASTGEYHALHATPTGIASDPYLASYGVEQSIQLSDKIMTLDPPVDVVYSSPFYRCLQTIKPTMEKLATAGRTDGKVRVDNGISEFFGTARFDHPSPATLAVLHTHFPYLHASHAASIVPNTSGESVPDLHDRHAYALHRIIGALDADPSGPRALLLCTHAASMICIGRTLTGRMPEDKNEADFRCGTCSLSTFVRRKVPARAEEEVVAQWDGARAEVIPKVDWQGGKGVMGGWDCEVNGDCSFLTNGEERSWNFSGDESFMHIEYTPRASSSKGDGKEGSRAAGVAKL